jgi:hypothetical protein
MTSARIQPGRSGFFDPEPLDSPAGVVFLGWLRTP